jgi:hypothetical protein
LENHILVEVIQTIKKTKRNATAQWVGRTVISQLRGWVSRIAPDGGHSQLKVKKV